MVEEEKQKIETEEKKETKEKIVESPKEKVEEKTVEEKQENSEDKSKESNDKEEKPSERSRGGRGKQPWKRDDTIDVSAWKPKTKLGQEVKDAKITNIDEILDNDRKILESEIVDSLITVKSELINIGQSKGKFGGGKRRIWRQTQRKTKEGNVPTFSTLAVIGDGDGHVGVGSGRSMETLPAREKAVRKAKLEIFKVKRACSGFDCSCPNAHTVPFKVTGKAGSVRLALIPAAQGTGLVVANELKKVLKLAGIKDVYSTTTGKKRTTFNLIKAGVDALKKTNKK
jgi:small subunit ribosomal protein S5